MAGEPLLDRAHLEAQVAGDAALKAELLALFRGQCAQLLLGIAGSAGTPAGRADLAHTLKGSALAIGATRVAARAGEVEAELRAGNGTGSGANPSAALAEAVAATLAALAREG